MLLETVSRITRHPSYILPMSIAALDPATCSHPSEKFTDHYFKRDSTTQNKDLMQATSSKGLYGRAGTKAPPRDVGVKWMRLSEIQLRLDKELSLYRSADQSLNLLNLSPHKSWNMDWKGTVEQNTFF